MADRKISELTNITGANLADGDELVVVDASASETKAITFGEFKNALDTATGFVSITGDTMTGDLALSGADITFGDNDKAIFGAGSDLQIFHNGSHSIISEGGTGNLRLQGNNLALETSGGASYLTAAFNGSVAAFYAGSQKLATTSTGVDITGTLTSDGLTVDGAGVEVISVNSTQNGAQINFDSASTSVDWSIGVSNSADGDFLIYQSGSGSGDINLYTGGLKRQEINRNGDISFYEDTGTTAKFFWDASAESLGIGTSSPTTALHVLSGTGNSDVAIFSGANAARGLKISTLQGGAQDEGVDFDAHAGSTAFHTFSINGSERMRIDSSGNLLVGKTADNWGTTGVQVHGYGVVAASRNGHVVNLNRETTDGDIARFQKDGTTVGSIAADGGDMSIGTGVCGIAFNDAVPTVFPNNQSTLSASDGNIDLGASNARFKDLYLSGTTFVGEPSQIGAGETGVTVRGVGQIRVGRAGTGSATLVSFNNDNGEVGTIRTSGSSTSYNTSSDYRLKENVVDLTGAIDRIKQIPVHRFNFIADPDTTVDGFLAHEVQGIVPEAVTGTKDAMRDEEYEVTPAVLDDDGNVVTEAVMGTRSVPDYQGIDQSKLVPLLVATIKELEARITALEAN